MGIDRKKGVAEFQKEWESAKAPDVKSFAPQALPTLHDHLKQTRSIAPKKQSGMSGKE